MGIRDSYGKKYFQDPERCADLINYCIYHGEARVAPKDLKELDPTEILTLELEDAKGKAKKLSKEAYAVQKMRDILKSAVVRSDGKMHLRNFRCRKSDRPCVCYAGQKSDV